MPTAFPPRLPVAADRSRPPRNSPGAGWPRPEQQLTIAQTRRIAGISDTDIGLSRLDRRDDGARIVDFERARRDLFPNAARAQIGLGIASQRRRRLGQGHAPNALSSKSASPPPAIPAKLGAPIAHSRFRASKRRVPCRIAPAAARRSISRGSAPTNKSTGAPASTCSANSLVAPKTTRARHDQPVDTGKIVENLLEGTSCRLMAAVMCSVVEACRVAAAAIGVSNRRAYGFQRVPGRDRPPSPVARRSSQMLRRPVPPTAASTEGSSGGRIHALDHQPGMPIRHAQLARRAANAAVPLDLLQKGAAALAHQRLPSTLDPHPHARGPVVGRGLGRLRTGRFACFGHRKIEQRRLLRGQNAPQRRISRRFRAVKVTELVPIGKPKLLDTLPGLDRLPGRPLYSAGNSAPPQGFRHHVSTNEPR